MNKTEKTKESHKKTKEEKKADTFDAFDSSGFETKNEVDDEIDINHKSAKGHHEDSTSSAHSNADLENEVNSSASTAGSTGDDTGKTEGTEEGKKIVQLQEQVSQLNDKYLRMVAEFENFKKRTSKERSELFKTANKDVLVAVIPVIDDFERAEKALSSTNDPAAVKEGLLLISGKLKNILSQQGLKEMKSIGEPFDTDRHEAVTNIPAPSEEMKGTVIDEVEKGYFLNDKVIRYAKVIVGE